jgi:hypothetical protein
MDEDKKNMCVKLPITVIYMEETDGDPQIAVFSLIETLETFIKEKDLHWHDYAVIKGYPMKTFNEKVIW